MSRFSAVISWHTGLGAFFLVACLASMAPDARGLVSEPDGAACYGSAGCPVVVVMLTKSESAARAKELLPKVTSELKSRGIREPIHIKLVHYDGNSLREVWARQVEPVATVVMVGNIAVALDALPMTKNVSTVVYVGTDEELANLRRQADAIGANMVIAALIQNLVGKQMEIVSSLSPKGRKLCFVHSKTDVHALEALAVSRGWQTISIPSNELLARPDGYTAFSKCDVIFVPSLRTNLERKKIAASLAITGLPVLYDRAAFVEDGGLLAYEADRETSMSGMYDAVSEVLKGLSARELSDIRAHRYQLACNREAMQKLKTPLPPDLLRRVTRWY